MGLIVDYFGAPQVLIQPVPRVQVVGAIQNPGVIDNKRHPNNQVQQ